MQTSVVTFNENPDNQNPNNQHLKLPTDIHVTGSRNNTPGKSNQMLRAQTGNSSVQIRCEE